MNAPYKSGDRTDPQAHLKHLKSIPTIEAIADKCIECGFCERVCPSRELSLTPRQRIVVRREMVRQASTKDRSPLLQALEQDYPYMGIDTCAGDGMCATACPVNINGHSIPQPMSRHFWRSL